MVLIQLSVRHVTLCQGHLQD